MPCEGPLVPVFYDFASTLSYVAHRVLDRLAEPLRETGIRLDWRPIDLTEITGWKRGSTITGPRRDHVAAVARTLVGDVRLPQVWLDVRRVSAVALALSGTVTEPTWRERVWTGIYEEGRDPGDDPTVDGWIRDVGIEAPRVARASLLDLEPLGVSTARARALGVTAVPTLLLGEWPMAGIQDDQTMRAVLSRFASRSR